MCPFLAHTVKALTISPLLSVTQPTTRITFSGRWPLHYNYPGIIPSQQFQFLNHNSFLSGSFLWITSLRDGYWYFRHLLDGVLHPLASQDSIIIVHRCWVWRDPWHFLKTTGKYFKTSCSRSTSLADFFDLINILCHFISRNQEAKPSE